MARCAVVLLLLAPLARGQDDAATILKALQKRAAAAALEAGPSIACVLVSRSEEYATDPHWGVKPDPDHPGKLGRFDAAAARKKAPPGGHRALRKIAALDLSAPGHVPESYGGGVVVSRTGLILTNAHVIKNATRIYVKLSGKAGSWADIHASDPRSDLAVLRLLDPPEGLRPLPMGDGGTVREGDFLLSMSFGYKDDGPTISSGIVSKLRQRIPAPADEDESVRHRLTLHHYGTLIQTEARITPGVSGGALLDLDGKAVGLASALAGLSDERQGFAIPLDVSTQRIIDVLKKGEEVEYGFLGVVMERGAPRRGGGIRLDMVSPGAPAAKAGLRPGDIITAVDGHPIRNNDDIFLHVGMALAGRSVRVEVLRGGSRQAFNVTLAKFYVPGPVIAANRPPARFGLRVDWSSIQTQRNPFRFGGRDRAPPEGVVIREVAPDSPASRAGLQPDKFLTHVNGVAVKTPAEYQAAIEKAGDRAVVTVLTSEGHSVKHTLEGK
jgi:serine protease Do